MTDDTSKLLRISLRWTKSEPYHAPDVPGRVLNSLQDEFGLRVSLRASGSSTVLGTIPEDKLEPAQSYSRQFFPGQLEIVPCSDITPVSQI